MNFGRYQITREVGRGSMGVVYEALDPHIDRVVAVKVLRQDRMGTEAFVNRFLKEAKVIGRLSHPNIVAIYDVGEEQETVYIAMEFLTGISLADLAQGGALNAEAVVAYGVQMAEALDYAHQKGVVHRDIKPSNIVVQPDGWIKITDFGIAHIDDASATMQTQAGEILGTPSYMSPEQVLGKPVDGRSDLFSLGVILYELSTGKRAFGGREKNLASIFNEIIHVTPEEPFVAASLIPKRLSGIIMKALQKEPQNRFQTGSEFAAALKDSLNEPPPVEEVTSEPDTRKKSVFAVAAGVVAVLAACAVVFYFLAMKPEPQSVSRKNPGDSQSSGQLPTSVPPGSANSGSGTELQKPSVLPQTPAPTSPEPSAPKQSPGSTSPLQTVQTGKPASSPELVVLKVRTAPQGAALFVDGAGKGNTPLTVQLPKGTHQLKMSLKGYRDIEKQITIEESMEFPLSFTLKRAAGSD